MKRGRIIVTDGPYADLGIVGEETFIGDSYGGIGGTVWLAAQSTPAFGPLRNVDLWVGDIDVRRETLLRSVSLSPGCHHFQTTRPLEMLPRVGYLRLEVTSRRGNSDFRCLTNPLYIERT
jgi:hypothetical protein